MTGSKFLIAYREGREAHNAGLGNQNNRYPEGTRLHELWHAGWCHRNNEQAAMNQWDRVNPQADAPPAPPPEDLGP